MDVVAVISVRGDLLAAPDGGNRRAEVRDLTTRVVEVVLARHSLPARLEDPAQQVADERAAGIPDVERPGRVGRDELDVDRATSHRRDATPFVRLGEDLGDRRLERSIGEPEIQEPRRGNRRGGDRGRSRSFGRFARQLAGQCLGDRERGHSIRPGELHRQGRGEVTVGGLSGPLDFDRGACPIVRKAGQLAGRDRPRPGALNSGAHLGSNRYRGHVGTSLQAAISRCGNAHRTGAATLGPDLPPAVRHRYWSRGDRFVAEGHRVSAFCADV